MAGRGTTQTEQIDGAYHHGNLRRALLDEALKIIREQGADAMTLRDLARRTGVTHAAPRHHFRDKTALISALSQEGFALLDRALDAAKEEAGASPGARLKAMGRAYIVFATEHSDYFSVMFRPEPCLDWCDLNDSSERGRTWRHLIDSIVDLQEAGLAPRGNPMPIAIYVWSLLHGLAWLWVFGTLQFAPPETNGIEGLTDMVLQQAGLHLSLAAKAG